MEYDLEPHAHSNVLDNMDLCGLIPTQIVYHDMQPSRLLNQLHYAQTIALVKAPYFLAFVCCNNTCLNMSVRLNYEQFSAALLLTGLLFSLSQLYVTFETQFDSLIYCWDVQCSTVVYGSLRTGLPLRATFHTDLVKNRLMRLDVQ